MDHIFEADNVSYSYPSGEQALDGVTFKIAKGESVVILGANASGKSTLLQIMDGLIFPVSGEMRAFGEILTEEKFEDSSFINSFRKKVGLVFQESDAQLFCPTVRDEIAFGPLQLGLSREKTLERVNEMLQLGGLLGKEARPPFALSGGEKKKVALTATLATDPEILLMDEPTGGLDPRSQTWLVELIEKLRAEGRTLISATHDLSIVDEIADRVMVMGEDHRLWAEGKPSDILRDTDLLLKVNLIHEHAHRHPGMRHVHPHTPYAPHKHENAEN